MEDIYGRLALRDIPWNNEALPGLIAAAVTGRRPRPRRVIEFGCGAGNYVIALAKLGFDVTGVDIAEHAIAIATKAAESAGVAGRFVAADVLGELPALTGTYDFAYDWELLHHVFPDDREKYARNVRRLVEPRGTYLSVCFSEEDPQFGGPRAGKHRTTRLGTVLYFSSELEIVSLLTGAFVVEQVKTVDIRGKGGCHRAIYALARRQGGN